MDKFRIGASYYPEWWDESEWEDDFAKMEKLGFNVVRMGEFAWSWFEPADGKFNFEPMLRVLDIAEKHNIKVVMGTTTAVCPAWLYTKMPDIKGGNEHGRYDFGGRKGQCLSCEAFLVYAKRITEMQTKALGSHPAVIGWQLDNEPGFPFNDFDWHCRKGFREWLREKYGTIDKLNKAWFTMMWSNVYNDFDEIEIPVNACEGGWSPEVQLDYRRYFSFTFNRLLSMEAELVRKNSPGRFIYTNWPGANWSVNCFDGSEYLDYAAWDNYVPMPNRDNYRIQLRASMEHSFDRRLSNGKEKFLVAEQCAFPDADQKPEVMRAQTWLNVSHGAFATIFFEWRTPTGGFEQEYESVLARDKNYRKDTEPVFRKLTSELEKVYPLIDGAETPSDVAIVYSYENSWGTRGWTVDGFYDEEFFNAYSGFKNKLSSNVDVIGIDDDFSKYKVIVLPNHRIMTEEQSERIKHFVQNGGTVVLNTETATRDITNKMRELLKPGLLGDICGATATVGVNSKTVEDRTGETANVVFSFGEAHLSGNMDRLDTTTAKPIATYSAGRLKGTPAVTENSFGNGLAILYGTDGNDVYFYESLAQAIAGKLGLSPVVKVDDGILVSSRVKDGKEYIFAVNMKDTPVNVYLEDEMIDAITDKKYSGTVALDGYDVLMLCR